MIRRGRLNYRHPGEHLVLATETNPIASPSCCCLADVPWGSLTLVGTLVALVIVGTCVLSWLKRRCPACGKRWEKTGEIQPDGMSAGLKAYKERWQCHHCEYSGWQPKNRAFRK